jgi:hypothetical protein
MLVGAQLSGSAVDYFTRTEAGKVVRDWHSFWLSSSGMAAVILVMIVLTFRTSARIQPKAE